MERSSPKSRDKELRKEAVGSNRNNRYGTWQALKVQEKYEPESSQEVVWKEVFES